MPGVQSIRSYSRFKNKQGLASSANSLYLAFWKSGQSATKNVLLNASTDCNEQNHFDSSLDKTEPKEDSNCLSHIGGESSKKTLDITVKQEQLLENIYGNGVKKNDFNLFDESNSSQELNVYNIYEDIEYSVDSVKMEVNHSLEEFKNLDDLPSIKTDTVKDVKQENLVQDIKEENLVKDAKGVNLESEADFNVQEFENWEDLPSIRTDTVKDVKQVNLVEDIKEENLVKNTKGVNLESEADFKIQQEQLVENIFGNGDKKNDFNLFDESNSSQELNVYNIYEDIEYSVDSVKMEFNHSLEEFENLDDLPSIRTDTVKDVKQENLVQDIKEENLIKDAKGVNLESEADFIIQTPLKTYQRKNPVRKLHLGVFQPPLKTYQRRTPVRKRSPSCGAGIVKKFKKINNTLEQCVNGQGRTDYVQNPQVELNVKQSHMCIFCKKMYKCASKHFIEKHLEQIKLIHSKNLPITSSLQLWQCLGDFQRNIHVLESKLGNLIVLQSSVDLLSHYNSDQFLPCPECTGFVHKSQLYSHYCECESKLKRYIPATKEIILDESCKLLSYTLLTNACKHLNWKIKLHNESDAIVVKDDTCLQLLRLHMIKNRDLLGLKSGTMIREMTEKMSRLLLCCRHLSNNYKLVMRDILIPGQIILLILSVKTIVASTNDLEKIGLLEYLFSKIKTCVFILRGKCLLDGELSNADEHLKFYHTFIETWHKEVYKPKQFIKEIFDLQFVSSVTILKESLKSTIINLIMKIKSEKQPGDLNDLAKSTFCMICLFNPININVVEYLKVSEYAVRPDWRVDNPMDYEPKMSPIAFNLAKERFVVRTHFCGQKYDLLFTKEVKQAIDLLISNQVSSFVFSSFLKPSEIVSVFYNMCITPGFLNADMINDMEKRQFISFVTQLSDMSQEEEHRIKEWYCQSPFLNVNQLYQVFDECKTACAKMKQAIESLSSSPHGS